MGKIFYLITIAVLCLSFPSVTLGDQQLKAVKIDTVPVIDGNASDMQWQSAREIITHDKIAKIDIKLKALYTHEQVFFLVQFEDPNASVTHKQWTWDNDKKIYTMGPEREDVFVFLWSMEDRPVDLSIYSDSPRIADTWFWKACRTNPVGFADDKINILSISELSEEDNTEITTVSGKTLYLVRKADHGQSAYKTEMVFGYNGDKVKRFVNRTPHLSRADVQARGQWKDGQWTIEFARMLDVKHNDDVRFDLNRKYEFGVSRYEVAGRGPDSKATQPLYGCGDVGEKLTLIFSNDEQAK